MIKETIMSFPKKNKHIGHAAEHFQCPSILGQKEGVTTTTPLKFLDTLISNKNCFFFFKYILLEKAIG